MWDALNDDTISDFRHQRLASVYPHFSNSTVSHSFYKSVRSDKWPPSRIHHQTHSKFDPLVPTHGNTPFITANTILPPATTVINISDPIFSRATFIINHNSPKSELICYSFPDIFFSPLLPSCCFGCCHRHPSPQRKPNPWNASGVTAVRIPQIIRNTTATYTLLPSRSKKSRPRSIRTNMPSLLQTGHAGHRTVRPSRADR